MEKLQAEAQALQAEAIRMARRVAKQLTKADNTKRYATDVETKVAGLEKSANLPGGLEQEKKPGGDLS